MSELGPALWGKCSDVITVGLETIPGEVSHMLESRLPFALEISCSDLSRQQKRPSEKFPRHFCFYP